MCLAANASGRLSLSWLSIGTRRLVAVALLRNHLELDTPKIGGERDHQSGQVHGAQPHLLPGNHDGRRDLHAMADLEQEGGGPPGDDVAYLADAARDKRRHFYELLTKEGAGDRAGGCTLHADGDGALPGTRQADNPGHR